MSATLPPAAPAERFPFAPLAILGREVEGVVTWNVNDTCNYRCSYCTQRFMPERSWRIDDIDRYVRAFEALPGVWEIKLSGGEPFQQPGLDRLAAGLVGLGHVISVQTNFSAADDKLLRFLEATEGALHVFSASLHLEYATPEAFLARYALLRPWVEERGVRFNVTSVALPARLTELRDRVAPLLAAGGISFKVQPEKVRGRVRDYSADEQVTILALGGHNGTGEVAPDYFGRLCWAGGRYLAIKSDGQVWRCYPGSRFGGRYARLGSLHEGFAVLDEPKICPYTYCNCTVPIHRGMIEGRAALAGRSAMFVKYQHVRNGGIVAAVGSAVAAVVVGVSGGDPATVSPAVGQPSHVAPVGQAPSEAQIVALAESSSGGELKQKDALGRASPWKINLYDDDKDGQWDRVKVDRERDEAWDVSWSRDELGRWTRAEDGAVWRNGAWRGGTSVAEKPTTPATPVAPPEDKTTDAAVIALAAKPSGGVDKAKDALGPGTWKVNLYDDDKDGTWDRVKIDRDRDEKWDAYWLNKGGQWQGDRGRVWRDGRWAEAAAPPPATAKGPALKVVEAMRGRASGKKIKDLYRGSGPKVNLYDDDEDGVWDRAKIDVERDDTWDEKLTRKGDGFERAIEASGEVFVLDDGGWKKKD